MTEEFFEKYRLEMEQDLGVTIEPYTDEELDFMYEALKNLKEVVGGENDSQG